MYLSGTPKKRGSTGRSVHVGRPCSVVEDVEFRAMLMLSFTTIRLCEENAIMRKGFAVIAFLGRGCECGAVASSAPLEAHIWLSRFDRCRLRPYISAPTSSSPATSCASVRFLCMRPIRCNFSLRGGYSKHEDIPFRSVHENMRRDLRGMS